MAKAQQKSRGRSGGRETGTRLDGRDSAEPSLGDRKPSTHPKERLMAGRGCQTPSFRPAVREGNPMRRYWFPECAP